jgi:hypothetical protein
MASTGPDLNTAVSRRSSYLNSGGLVPVRDSKVPDGSALLIPAVA